MEMNTNSQLIEWKKYVEASIKAFESGDLGNMERNFNLSKEAFAKYKDEQDLQQQMEQISFGYANYIVEQNIFNLFKNNKEALKEYNKLIKEDINLNSQLQLINSIMDYHNLYGNNNLYEYINESINITRKNINSKTIQESNIKILDFIQKYNLKINEDIDDNLFNIYENIDLILKGKTNLKKLQENTYRIRSICENLEKIPSSLINENKSENKNNISITDFEKKYNDELNEEEKKIIADFFNNKTETFIKTRDLCIEHINKTINECTNNEEREQLKEIKKNIESLSYNDENILESIIKILEINEVLTD